MDGKATLNAALSDPAGFIGDLRGPVVLDEVQRAPGLFTSIKIAVDRNRGPGRFLLTGSAKVLLVPTLADSLAGRMAILRLHGTPPVCRLAWFHPASPHLDTGSRRPCQDNPQSAGSPPELGFNPLAPARMDLALVESCQRKRRLYRISSWGR